MRPAPRVSVYTPSFNKGAYLLDAFRSLQAQVMPDWEWWLMDNSTDPASLEYSALCAADDDRVIRVHAPFTARERELVNPMAVLLNRFYGKANGDIIMYLSDDDLFAPHVLKLVTGYLDEHPEAGVCWFTLQLVTVTAPGQCGPWPLTDGIVASGPRGSREIDNRTDGGQIAHRTSCLHGIARPWFPEQAQRSIAAHCDGVFMEKLAEHHVFHPCGDPMIPGVVHRYTPLHSWHPPGELRGLH